MNNISHNIANALAGNLDPEVAINREVLLAAVMHQITCSRSGKILDVESAVYAKVTQDGKSNAYVVDGSAWDEIKEAVETTCKDKGIDLEVIDGRVVNAKGYGERN